jgi:hypothetical protein
MSVQWVQNSVQAGQACPIVEFHEVLAEPGYGPEMLEIAAKSGPLLGLYRVGGPTERLVALRGYADSGHRARVLGDLHARPDWPAIRRRRADLARAESVHLMRAITPEGGLPLYPRARPASATMALISDLRFAEQIGSYHLWLRLFLRMEGLDPLASLATLEMENDIPAEPVVRYRTEHIALLPANGEVPPLPPELRAMLRSPPQVLRLEPAGPVR